MSKTTQLLLTRSKISKEAFKHATAIIGGLDNRKPSAPSAGRNNGSIANLSDVR